MKKTVTTRIRHFFPFPFFLLMSIYSFSEGTKQMRPSSSDKGSIVIGYSSRYNNFASVGCLPEERLHITVCEAGEVIYYGVQFENDYERNRKWRLIDPNGNIVAGHTLKNIPKNNGETGYIRNYNQAVAGPEAIVGTNGYKAMSHISTMVGDYYLEFETGTTERTRCRYFDITVADKPGGAAIDGRVWSQAWCMTVESFTNRYNGSMFMYSDDMITTKLDFNGIQPYVFTIYANSTGVKNTGDFSEDRKSVVGQAQYPQYKIFLNEPDINCYPTGNFGTLTKDPDVTGCSLDKCINIYSDSPGSVEILLDLSLEPGYQKDTRDVLIAAEIIAGANCIPWNSTDGLGNEVLNGAKIDIRVDYLNGITHLPMVDVEEHDIGYSVSLVRPSGGAPLLFWDDIKLSNGSDLNGCNGDCHTWGYDVGNRNTINTWWYANIIERDLEITNVTLGIDADSTQTGNGDNNDRLVCKDGAPIQLFGKVEGASGGKWTTNGDGVFSSDGNDLIGTYTPGPTDHLNQPVILTLTSTGNGDCTPVSDYTRISFQENPQINIGDDIVACENNSEVELKAIFSNSTGIEWIGGNGDFIPNRQVDTATYQPTLAEIATGLVPISAITTGNGICDAQEDELTVKIDLAPIVDAGDDREICENNNLISLDGSYQNTNGIKWTSDDPNGVFSNQSDTNSSYLPSPNEIENGSFHLTIKSDAPGVCKAITDQVLFTVTPAPSVNAGNAILGCSNSDTITLNGTFNGSDSAVWSGGTNSFNLNASSLSVEYILNEAEMFPGNTFALYYRSTGNGLCNEVIDSTIVTIQQAPSVTISAPTQTICANVLLIRATASTSNSSGLNWVGNGTFSPSKASKTVDYKPTDAEKALTRAAISVYADNIEGCEQVSDTLTINILPTPIINAGNDVIVCENNSEVTLNGFVFSLLEEDTISPSNWSGGDGTFLQNKDILFNTYQPGKNDLNNGFVDLVLEGTALNCNPTYDTLRVSFDPKPEIVAASLLEVCENNTNTRLSAIIKEASGVKWSTSGGVFDNDTSLTPIFTADTNLLSGNIIKVFASTTGIGKCAPVTDSIEITLTAAPKISLSSSDVTVCSNNSKVSVQATLTGATQGIWSGGNGSYKSNKTDLSLDYKPSQVEKQNGTIQLYITTTDNGNCNSVSDTLNIIITQKPKIKDFIDQRICGNSKVTYELSLDVASGVRIIGGTGTFNPDNTSQNFTYTPSAEEILTGNVSLIAVTTNNANCKAVSKTKTITIDPIPILSAGNDQIVCDDSGPVLTNGHSENIDELTWSTLGSGTFSSRSNAISEYNPSDDDYKAGSVKLILLGTGRGTCKNITDTVKISFSKAPTITAGSNQIVCTNALPVRLGASGSPGEWTGGNGTFSPNRSSLNALYTPSAAEIKNKTVNLFFTTTTSGSCISKSDGMRIDLEQSPEVDAGSNQTVCGNQLITLNGTVKNATGGFWTTDGKGSIAAPTNIVTNYLPTSNDTLLSDTAFVMFYFSSTGNGLCASSTDTIVVKLAPVPLVDAGEDQEICSDGQTTLSGSVLNALDFRWSGGNGFFDSDRIINATYTPAPADTVAGNILLTLSWLGNDICPASSDQTNLSFQPTPLIDLGNDISLCADSTFISLSANVSNASSVKWASSGSGTFSPSAYGKTPNYYPTEEDTLSGSIQLTATSTGNGLCDKTMDDLSVTFKPAPVIDAGEELFICADATSITLNGSLVNASQGTWSTNGNGTFDDVNKTKPTYTLAASDYTLNTIKFNFKTVDHGICKQYQDDILVRLTPSPTAHAGIDQIVCASEDSIKLKGNYTIAQGMQWSSSGNGKFVDSDTTKNAIYLPTVQDTTAGAVFIYLTTTKNGLCKAVKDSFNLKFEPTHMLELGEDITICSDSAGVQITAAYAHSKGINWFSKGSNQFFRSAFSDSTTFVPSNADTAAREATIYAKTNANLCPSVTDSMIINIDPQPIISISADFSICADNINIPLTSAITHAKGQYWSTNGSGLFNDSLLSAPRYTPSAIDTLAGGVTLTVTSRKNGLCKAVSKTTTIQLQPLPILFSGADQTICSSNMEIIVNGSSSNTSGNFWTSMGGGTFNDSLALKSTYYPSNSDKLNGSVKLILNSITGTTCENITDTITINIQPLPEANAGKSTKICADSSFVKLDGKVRNATGGKWSKLTANGYLANNNDLKTLYTPTAEDTTNGQVDLLLTSEGNGVCPATTDTFSILITPEIQLSIDPDITACIDVDFINVSGISKNSSGTKWTNTGDGAFQDEQAISTQFIPFVTSSPSNFFVVTLTAFDTINGCKTKSENLKINLIDAPSADAGGNLTVCDGIDSIPLNGFTTNAQGGRWDTKPGASGTFGPTQDSSSTYYLPSKADFSKGSITLAFYSKGTPQCLDDEDTIQIQFSPTPPISAGEDTTICATDLPFQLQGALNNGTWSGGNGVFEPNRNAAKPYYTPTAAELLSGIRFIRTSKAFGACLVSEDDVKITFKDGPTVDAGTAISSCSNETSITLNGSSSIPSQIKWTTNGTGTFVDANTTITKYIPSSDDKNNESIVLKLETTLNNGCLTQEDTLHVNFVKYPTVSAGTDRQVCAENPTIKLNGVFAESTGSIWSGGTNSNFTDINSPQSAYTPSASEIASGSVKLILTTINNTNCSPAKDSLTITIAPAPTVLSYNDTTICASTNVFQLNSNVSGAKGVRWSTSGAGIFSPSDTAINAIYQSDLADIQLGTTRITLSSEGNGVCNAAQAEFDLLYQNIPEIKLNFDTINACENETSISINATPIGASGILWQSSGNGTFGNSNSKTTTYSPSTNDLFNSSVILIARSTENGVCDTSSTSMTINFIELPDADAGFDREVCANANKIRLNGDFKFASKATWSTKSIDGGTFYPSDSSMTSFYLPSAKDSLLGFASLLLTTSAQSSCPQQIDTMKISLSPIPTVQVPDTLYVCDDTIGLTLSGKVMNAPGASWTTSGDGTFRTSSLDSSGTYILGDEDLKSKYIGLKLTNTGNNICPKASDQLIVSIQRKPQIAIQSALSICESETEIPLSATGLNTSTTTWISSTFGTFTSPNQLSNRYLLSSLDQENGYIDLELKVGGLKTCKPTSKIIRVNMQELPILEAGPNVEYCANNAISLYDGFVEYGTSYWSTSGSGNFSPDATALEVIYTPSAKDTSDKEIELYLNWQSDGVCSNFKDSLSVVFSPEPYVNLTNSQLCEVKEGVQLKAEVSNNNTGLWTKKAGGLFSTSANQFSTKFFPTINEFITTDSVILSFTTDQSQGCKETTKSITIDFEPLPIANAGPTIYNCRDAATTLSAKVYDNLSYSWKLDGLEVSNEPTATITATNDLKVIVHVTDNRNCQSTDTVLVNIYDLPTFKLKSPFCYNDSLYLDAAPENIPDVPGNFQWYKDGSLQQGQNTRLNFISNPGEYTIVYYYQQCSTAANSTVHYLPEVDLTNVIGCTSDSVILSTPDKGYQYNWSINRNNIGNKPSVTTLTIKDSTFYLLDVKDFNGCTSKDSLEVLGIDKPVINLSDTNACENQSVILVASPTNYSKEEIERYSPRFTWFNGTSNTGLVNDSIKVTEDGLYIATITIDQCKNRDTSKVIFHPYPISKLPEDEQTYCEEDTIGIVLDAGETTLYYWEPTGDTTRTILAIAEGNYKVTLTNLYGCGTTDSVDVNMICPPVLHTPTAFTPGLSNDDDEFRVFSKYIEDYNLTIYNRWGEVIFYSEDINEGWDGSYLGEIMPVGTYPWIINYKGEGQWSTLRVKNGRVTLLK